MKKITFSLNKGPIKQLNPIASKFHFRTSPGVPNQS